MSLVTENGVIADPSEIAATDFFDVSDDDFYEQHAPRNEETPDETEAFLVEQDQLITTLESLRQEMRDNGGIDRSAAQSIQAMTVSVESISSFFTTHPMSSFTSDKSRVNYNATYESLTAEIGLRIKNIAKTVIEYLKKAAAWVKNLFTGRAARDAKFTAAEKAANEKLKNASGKGDAYHDAVVELVESNKNSWSHLDTLILGRVTPTSVYGQEPLTEMLNAITNLTTRFVAIPEALASEYAGVAHVFDFREVEKAVGMMVAISGQEKTRIIKISDIVTVCDNYGQWVNQQNAQKKPDELTVPLVEKILASGPLDYTKVTSTDSQRASAIMKNATSFAEHLENVAAKISKEGREGKYAQYSANTLRQIAAVAQRILTIRETIMRSREKVARFKVAAVKKLQGTGDE